MDTAVTAQPGGFAAVLTTLFSHEGGFTADPADAGNWTSGACGRGRCVGTKYGISAAAYPGLDIPRLTLEDAEAIYRRDYWNRIKGDEMPAGLGLLVFDSAVNNGVSRAAKWLQAALGVTIDGELGPRSMAALAEQAGDWRALALEFHAQRLAFMGALPTWKYYGLGWSRRLCRLLAQAMDAGAVGTAR